MGKTIAKRAKAVFHDLIHEYEDEISIAIIATALEKAEKRGARKERKKVTSEVCIFCPGLRNGECPNVNSTVISKDEQIRVLSEQIDFMEDQIEELEKEREKERERNTKYQVEESQIVGHILYEYDNDGNEVCQYNLDNFLTNKPQFDADEVKRLIMLLGYAFNKYLQSKSKGNKKSHDEWLSIRNELYSTLGIEQ